MVCREAKLAIALRFLAGGSPLDLQLIYCVSKSYVVYDCVWLAVDEKLKIVFPAFDDVAKLRVLEAEWSAKSRCPWRGQVGTVDGRASKLGPRFPW